MEKFRELVNSDMFCEYGDFARFVLAISYATCVFHIELYRRLRRLFRRRRHCEIKLIGRYDVTDRYVDNINGFFSRK